jgi:hypothetical protein
MTLEELLPGEDYRFQFRFERSEPREFFKPTSNSEGLLAERRHWLEAAPERYAALLPQGRPLLEETIELARRWEIIDRGFPSVPTDPQQSLAHCLALGGALEPDFLLLKPEASGVPHLFGGVVCFPSSWSLEEKIGKPITAIHGVVPGLNDALGSQINGFLAKLRPGVAWLRNNWGLSRCAELNQHPVRKLSRLDPLVRPDEVWLRVEQQALVALPRTGGILFGIRISNYVLSEILKDQVVSERLARALKTMPADVAAYKGLAAAKECLLAFLQFRSG